MLDNVARRRAIQPTEAAQVIVEFPLPCRREHVVNMVTRARHERDHSRVFAFSAPFAWESLKEGGLEVEEVVVCAEEDEILRGWKSR